LIQIQQCFYLGAHVSGSGHLNVVTNQNNAPKKVTTVNKKVTTVNKKVTTVNKHHYHSGEFNNNDYKNAARKAPLQKCQHRKI
jgi:hypothetical protein